MENFNIEELKTAVGHIMLDLRGNWAFQYEERLKAVCSLLTILIKKDEEKRWMHQSEFDLAESEIEEPSDGRVFRDSAYLYSYSSDEGRTQRVKDYLQTVLTYPEYNQIEVCESGTRI